MMELVTRRKKTHCQIIIIASNILFYVERFNFNSNPLVLGKADKPLATEIVLVLASTWFRRRCYNAMDICESATTAWYPFVWTIGELET